MVVWRSQCFNSSVGGVAPKSCAALQYVPLDLDQVHRLVTWPSGRDNYHVDRPALLNSPALGTSSLLRETATVIRRLDLSVPDNRCRTLQVDCGHPICKCPCRVPTIENVFTCLQILRHKLTVEATVSRFCMQRNPHHVQTQQTRWAT